MVTERAWRIVGLHHVAFAHGDDPATEAALCRLIGTEALEEEGPGFVERMYGVGDAYLQTLEADGDGVVQRFLDKRGPGLHHVAFTVDRIDAALEDLRGQGVRLVDERPRPGAWARGSPSCTRRASEVCWSSSWSRPARRFDEPGRSIFAGGGHRGQGATGGEGRGSGRRVQRPARPPQGDRLGLRGGPPGDHRSPAQARGSRCGRRRSRNSWA